MPKYLREIFRLTLQDKRRAGALFALLLLATAARLGEPYLYKVVVDTLTNGLVSKVFTSSAIHTLILSVVVWFVLAVIVNISTAQSSYLTWKTGHLNSDALHTRGYQRLLRLDYAEYIKDHSSRLSKIVDDADNAVWQMSNWWLNRFASAFLGFIGMLVIAFAVSWQMTLIAVAVIPPTLWFIMRHVKRYEDEQRRVNKLWEAKHEHLSDQVSNIITYKLNPDEEVFLGRHMAYSKEASAAQLALNKRWRTVDMLNPDAIARFLVLGSGIFFVQNGSITLGTLFMFMGLLNEILIPLHVLGDILPEYTRRAHQIERLLDLLAQRDVVVSPPDPVDIADVQGDIRFDHVSFSWGEQSGFMLKDLSFHVASGKTVALVGHSGSGKTTIMTLLNRLVEPTEGTITIDDLDLRRFDLEQIKKYVGTVLQENAMYNETIAENIAYGNAHATRENIIHAATQAHAHEFIDKLPKGYDTQIGERGMRLSGGEKQRIAIARAILKDPRIVILDEPTSALDSITEAKVQKGLNALMKGRSTLVIAHRLSTVREADTILVLEEGRIIGSGPHTELIKNCSTYQQMVALQIGGFLADQ